MTNLEFYKNEIKEKIKREPLTCVLCEIKKGIRVCDSSECLKLSECIDWLSDEYKEPIKLKQLEYDLINDVTIELKFSEYGHFKRFKAKGHFKGVTDTSMNVKEILSNCIIVADDYDGFEECK